MLLNCCLLQYRYDLIETCYIFYICLYVYVLVYLCLIYMICFFIIIFIFINYIISWRQKSLFFEHVCQKFSLRVLINFCQFQPGVAYCNWKKRTLMLTFNFDFQNCQTFVHLFTETSPALRNSWLPACTRYL